MDKMYCKTCGARLIETKIPMGFDEFTGEQKFATIRACPAHPAGDSLRPRPPERWPLPTLDDLYWNHTRCQLKTYCTLNEFGGYWYKKWVLV